MKAIGCKTFSKEIDELESGQAPGAEIEAHLKACGSCRSFYDDREKLREMIAGLETIEAPGDFEFRLRARLANQRAERTSALSSFGFGLPSIALAVLALVIGIGIYMRGTTQVEAPLAQTEVPKTAEPVVVPVAGPSVTPDYVDTTELSPAGSRELALVPGRGSESVMKERVRSRKGSRNPNSNTVRRDDLLAQSESSAMFPLEAAEPLRVSVDYATGGSRTISLPTVSFGSQQVVARGASMMKTSARTVW